MVSEKPGSCGGDAAVVRGGTALERLLPPSLRGAVDAGASGNTVSASVSVSASKAEATAVLVRRRHEPTDATESHTSTRAAGSVREGDEDVGIDGGEATERCSGHAVVTQDAATTSLSSVLLQRRVAEVATSLGALGLSVGKKSAASIAHAFRNRSALQRVHHTEVHPTHVEDYILRGYRKDCSSLSDCVASAFVVHNETGNIWTHFVAFLVFVLLFCDFLLVRTTSAHTLTQQVLFGSYIVCMMMVWLASTGAHTFCCISPATHLLVFKFDYISIFFACPATNAIVGYFIYPHDDWATFRVVNLVVTTLFAMLFSAVLFFADVADPRLRALRAVMLLVSTFSSMLPFFLSISGTFDTHETTQATALSVLAMFATGGTIYYVRFPERLSPGRFDIVGHSHQWLHVFGFVTHMVIYKFCLDKFVEVGAAVGAAVAA